MDTVDKTPTEPQPKMELTTSQLPPDTDEKIKYIYINNTFLFISNWDVRFVFAERLPTDKVEPRVGIVMSHQHAKAFLEVFTANIKGLEAMMGEIIHKLPTAPPAE